VRAAANARLVGKQLAFLLKGLNKHNGLEFSKVHIIGFSLGAHASGKVFKNELATFVYSNNNLPIFRFRRSRTEELAPHHR
jgi:hypothetical protein